ncbi:CDP-diacylglycerol--glycerol-3-phosphate 3-phosphatidyltransferase [Spiroplasma taiwanense]|uniref:CDP-diacylglycerol--glycerol-3-phosphate 3-phosphatidyltransferase n=1 Tax=Spiroplasma taiwanense CT-1 TaxID=1276220 RepID=S5MI38_9MOLU|nr:CDP-diacylglycerol--glycerol-3-phosphate 3-phosphatidyltransferase [Spiroplasma taiwanense]AGR41555.1 CDP-diacylglycerol-glycerol-3-phosphate 3-phosphatidyltransferase [Spiroplasma taiwanense CT-1]
MNLANKITMVRIILIPIIIILLLLSPNFYQVFNNNIKIGENYELSIAYLIAGILFIIASLTDMLDGYIARKYNMVTNFGKFFDSIADKLLTNSVLIVFACGQIPLIPVWMCVILICRDFLIDVVRQVLANSSYVMAANKMGKYKATFEMIGLSLLFFIGLGTFKNLSNLGEYGGINQLIMIPMYITVILSIISAAIYIYLNRKMLFNISTERGTSDDKK